MNTFHPLEPVAISPHRIYPGTKPIYVHLKVANLDREIAFYQNVLGFELNWQTGDQAGLGVSSRDLVRLTRIPKGRRYRGVTGLYHFAVLLPDRRELARAIARLFAWDWPNYPTDHVMTKATYLDDPEGNTIELYCESPEDGIFQLREGELIAQWADGRQSNGREPLDLQSLFSHLRPQDD
ncbi:MAG: VOC family protein, partial [Thermanaerothrix sp.]|nr:VOC family protein [Thermanaerothrix sp.]